MVHAAAVAHLQVGEHVVWSEVPGGQRRKEYTPAGLTLLRSLLTGAVEKIAEKEDSISLPGLGFTIWLKNAPKTPPDSADEKKALTDRAAAEKPAGELQRPPVSLLLIVRICPNPIWIIVLTPDKKTAEVRVRHSRLLVPGKRVRCAPDESGRWECVEPLLTTNPKWR